MYRFIASNNSQIMSESMSQDVAVVVLAVLAQFSPVDFVHDTDGQTKFRGVPGGPYQLL